MLIVFDIDGCILDFSSAIREHCRVHNPSIDLNTTDYGFGLRPELCHRLIVEFWRSPESSKIPFFPGAVSAFNRIASQHTAVIVSAFPEEFREAREENLKSLFYDTMILSEKHKERIVELLRPDLVIEDKPTLIKSQSRWVKNLLYPGFNKYSRSVIHECDPKSNILSFDSWDQVPGIVHGIDARLRDYRARENIVW